MTTIEISGGAFHLDGRLANEGRTVRGIPVDGLLMNSRMINGVFDDLNPETAGRWAYPDTGVWDAERNVREFIEAIPLWKANGLDCFTVGVQGGSPHGYSKEQPWDTGGYDPDGALRPAFAERLRRVLDAADEAGMVVIVDYFYQGQEMRLVDEAAVKRAVVETTEFLLAGGWRNVLVEIANEINFPWEYNHSRIMRWDRVHELIALAQSVALEGRRLLVSTSFAAIEPIMTDPVVRVADWVLLHGNGTPHPDRLREMVEQVRAMEGYRGQPIMFNEDDHFRFDREENHMVAALRAGASWGYFDPGAVTVYPEPEEPEKNAQVEMVSTLGDYVHGYQAMPANWGINTDLKRAFFDALS